MQTSFVRRYFLILICFISLIFYLPLQALAAQTAAEVKETEKTTHATTKISPAEVREQQLSDINRWQINGKIAVQTNQDAGSAQVMWSRNGGRFVIELYGTLGNNSIKLWGQPGHVIMMDSKGNRYSARSAEELLGRVWGYHVPISHLIYWVRGLPVPGMHAQKYVDAHNRLSSLRQGGWVVQFGNYTRVGKVDLPSKIFVASRQLKSKLIIYQWHAH